MARHTYICPYEVYLSQTLRKSGRKMDFRHFKDIKKDFDERRARLWFHSSPSPSLRSLQVRSYTDILPALSFTSERGVTLSLANSHTSNHLYQRFLMGSISAPSGCMVNRRWGYETPSLKKNNNYCYIRLSFSFMFLNASILKYKISVD